MKTIEIYFGDLIPEKQKELLDAVPGSTTMDMRTRYWVEEKIVND